MTKMNCAIAVSFRTLLALCAFPFFATGANFADHLEPEDGPFVYAQFGERINNDVNKLISTVDYRVNTGLLLIADDQITVVTLGAAERGGRMVRYAELSSTENRGEIKVFSKPIETECFRKIEKIWRTETSRAYYAKRHRLISGGIIYHFYSFADGRSCSGFAASVGSPRQLPSLSNLLSIANLLAAYTKCDRNSEGIIMEDMKKRIHIQLKREARAISSSHDSAAIKFRMEQ